MPPKKKKGKTPVESEKAADAIKAVDRTFYELTITDLNTKLANLRTYHTRTDERNIQLETQMRSLEEDRTDVTAYLDRTLQEKTNINRDLEEKLSELATVRTNETVEFRRQLREQDLRYKQMQDELTSEIKLLTGKLNSLEEFRVQKDELLSKFDQQQDELRIQTKQHNEIVYEIERQQIIDKDRMKRDVESRLLELSNEFAKSNEIRIAAHVQRLVRENIALNNELDRMMFSQRRLQTKCEEMESEAHQRRATVQTVLDEKAHLVRVGDTRLHVIEKLTDEIEQLQQRTIELAEVQRLRADADARAAMSAKRTDGLLVRVRHLEQQLHVERTEGVHYRTVYRQQAAEFKRFAQILQHLQFSIRSAMREDSGEDASLAQFREAQRKSLLDDMMELLLQAQDAPPAVPSLETVMSEPELYRNGDLGAVRPALSIGSVMTMHKPFATRTRRSRQSIAQLMAEHDEREGRTDVQQEETDGEAGSSSDKLSLESCPIIDLHSGTSLILSESSLDGGGLEEGDGDRPEDEDAGVSVSE